jgi:two-component system response regulator YesN
MERAAEMLRGSVAPVNQVASAVGYRQPAQFAKAFRRHHGSPPSAFRVAGRQALAA